MARSTRFDWFLLSRSSLARPGKGRLPTRKPFYRRLGIEPLEDRRLLTITVNTLVDENDGVGVGGVSLRDAIVAAAPTRRSILPRPSRAAARPRSC